MIVVLPCYPIVTNNCANEPCLNGATCISLDSGYACLCATGWSGLNCNMRDFGKREVNFKFYSVFHLSEHEVKVLIAFFIGSVCITFMTFERV